ncbi:MAG: sterol desaturase family protein [Bacteroidia bacterium]|nr:sterol desaturase family protein [Bacteroidia bacterium]
MKHTLFGIQDLDVYVVAGILILFGLLEVFAGFLSKSKRSTSDWIQEFGSFAVLSKLIKPGIVFAVFYIGKAVFPNYQFALDTWSLWLVLPFYLLIDDVLQYWYHRLAHEKEWLWKLHRPHHQAEEMGFFVSYRNAALYYILMPNIWWLAAITFLGGGSAVALGLILKQLIIIGSHSRVKWDVFFYRRRYLHPIITVLERIFITPAFHHAHHGRSMADRISDPNGNYGNMFSFWDQIFGTATFTREFPSDYGLQNDTYDHWSASYLYPLVASDKEGSAISRNYVREKTTSSAPLEVELERGKIYLFCQCGFSKTQPFCDGSHQGSKFKPMPFEVKKDAKARLCNCKLTKRGPFCDGSHLHTMNQDIV